jgi:uncharacterized membrane protein YedE/YeeE
VLESILMALLGGALIGLAASALLLLKGRVCGISGMLGGLLSTWTSDHDWRLAFVGGLLVGGLILLAVFPAAFHAPTGRSMAAVIAAGALVGFGTRLGNGCTSGHGVCGLTRFSGRSLVATCSFMAAGFITATLLGAL